MTLDGVTSQQIALPLKGSPRRQGHNHLEGKLTDWATGQLDNWLSVA